MNRPRVEISEAYLANRRWWDDVTGPHLHSAFYDVAGFRNGRSSLPAYVQEEVGDVEKKKLLHLQCHFGLDTLSWARLGADVTGVDFGGEAIRQARQLATEVGIEARFDEANIYDLGDRFDGAFDIVFTSYGALPWLHDLRQWAEIITNALKPGGLFYMAEFHPFFDTLQDGRPIAEPVDAHVDYPYFDPGEPLVVAGRDGADYADTTLHTGRDTYEWFHSLEDVIGSLLRVGLRIEMFREQDFCLYRARRGMARGADGFWRLPEGVPSVPLMYSLRARKPA